MSERSLGIEITPSQIKAVEMDASATPPKVYRFATSELFSSQPENISGQLRSTLSRLKIRTRRARLAVVDENAHHILSLPSMPKKEMNVVVEREMNDLLGNRPEEMAFGWQILGDDETGKKMVLATAVSSEPLRDKALLLKDAGLFPDLITTEPLALFSASRLVEGVDLGISCLVHLGESRGYAVFIRYGKWAFYRNLPGSGTDQEELVEEINRSLLYYRHQFRGEDVARVILSGEGVAGREKRWAESLGTQTNDFRPYLDFSPLKGRAEEFRHDVPEFAIPIGLAGKRVSDAISLRDPETTKTLRQAGLKRLSVMGLIATLLLLAASYGYLSHGIARNQRALTHKQQALNRLKPYLTARKSRLEYDGLLAQLREIDDHAYWAEILKELSRTVPPAVAIETLRFKREEEYVSLTFKGQVVASKELSGREVLSRFYTQWESSPLLTEVALEPTSVRVLRLEETDPHPIRIGFEISGQLAEVEIAYEVD